MKIDKGGEFHPSFPVTGFSWTLLPGWIPSPASQHFSIAIREIWLEMVFFPVTLMLTQPQSDIFHGIQKVKVVNRNPQSVNAVNCFFLSCCINSCKP